MDPVADQNEPMNTLETTENDVSVDHRQRKLVLDNEDLKFECARLKMSLERAQHEIQALTDRNTALQHRIDRIERFAPFAIQRLLSTARSWFGR